MSLIENVKTAVEVVQKSDNIDLMKKMMAIQSDAWELQQENQKLKERIRELERKREIDSELDFQGNKYWSMPEGGEREGPYCSPCWDDKGKLIRLHRWPNGNGWECGVCKKRISGA